jgi:hypothetical protein
MGTTPRSGGQYLLCGVWRWTIDRDLDLSSMVGFMGQVLARRVVE